MNEQQIREDLIRLYEGRGYSRRAAEFAAGGRPAANTTEAFQARGGGGGGLVAESTVALSVAETEVRQAARSTLGMTDAEATAYATRQREQAVREHGQEGARVYLRQLRESIGRAR